MKRALIVIAQKGFQDVEYFGTRDALEDAGFSIDVASKTVGTCTGKFGGSVEATVAMNEVDLERYDRVAFIGGPGAAILADDPDALALARNTMEKGLPLGAICIAPTILAKAGLLEGKNATVWDDGQQTQINLLTEYGAHYSGEDVTVDGKIVTANGPAAAEEFGKTFADLPA